MKIMLEIFFKDIPSIVFEPIVILGWLGLITALVLYRKERTAFYMTVIFSLAFMIIWRMAIQIISSRYAEILIFPMTVAAAFFIFQLANIRKIFPQFPEKYAKYIPVCILTVVTVICIGKNLNYNTYTPIMDAGNLIRQDKTTEKCAVYVMNPERLTQIEYYAGKKAHSVTVLTQDPVEELTPELCRNAIRQTVAGNIAETIYIFAIASRKEPVITAKEVAVNGGEWELFAEKFFNRKHKKILRVYKYTLKKQALQKSGISSESGEGSRTNI